jgi:hypothetical protein
MARGERPAGMAALARNARLGAVRLGVIGPAAHHRRGGVGQPGSRGPPGPVPAALLQGPPQLEEEGETTAGMHFRRACFNTLGPGRLQTRGGAGARLRPGPVPVAARRAQR